MAAARASPQPRVTLEAPSSECSDGSWLAGAPGGAGGGSWDQGRGNRTPRTPGVVDDYCSQLPVLALRQSSGWPELAPGLRPEGGARAGVSRPVSAWLSTEVSWRPEPPACCSHSVSSSKAGSPFLPWR